jgi:hypothetical protein
MLKDMTLAQQLKAVNAPDIHLQSASTIKNVGDQSSTTPFDILTQPPDGGVLA